jgi:hypothetical protein
LPPTSRKLEGHRQTIIYLCTVPFGGTRSNVIAKIFHPLIPLRMYIIHTCTRRPCSYQVTLYTSRWGKHSIWKDNETSNLEPHPETTKEQVVHAIWVNAKWLSWKRVDTAFRMAWSSGLKVQGLQGGGSRGGHAQARQEGQVSPLYLWIMPWNTKWAQLCTIRLNICKKYKSIHAINEQTLVHCKLIPSPFS